MPTAKPGYQAEYYRRRKALDPSYGTKKLTPEQNRVHKLKHFYKMSVDDYEALLSDQGGRCAICGTDDPGRNRVSFCVDHDHACCPGNVSCGKCIRGLLCDSCNRMLGTAKDNPKILLSAVSYLEKE
jgi:hypothetical protein